MYARKLANRLQTNKQLKRELHTEMFIYCEKHEKAWFKYGYVTILAW